MAVEQIDGQLYAHMIQGGAARLRLNEQEINGLNVFPIPDGDTGSNMRLTIDNGVTALSSEEITSVSHAAQLAAKGMLMGARGNSGVILSQLFAGMGRELSDCETASVHKLAKAFRSGVELAYEAVINPTEGTILTVAREAADYAYANTLGGGNVEKFFMDYLSQARKTLKKTPDMLHVLKEAGVVDSGGAGLIRIVEGMEQAVTGREIQPAEQHSASPAAIKPELFTEDSEMHFGYCTECLLRLQRSKVDPESFRVEQISEYLETIGNSIVAFKTGSAVKIHVHTMTPGKVLDFCQKFGEFLTLKIENMELQHNNVIASEKREEKPRKKFGVIAAANGDGIKQSFSDLGADFIVDGGQCMNPSTEDFIDAFDRVSAEKIIVLPNNGNIILAARQAAQLYDKTEVYVLESRSIGEGYAALTMLDTTSGNIDVIMNDLECAMQGVKTVMVSKSVRDAELGGMSVKSGEYIAISEKSIIAAENERTAAAKEAVKNIISADTSILLIFRGADAPASEAEELAEFARENFPAAEIYEIDGKQEIYDFILVSE